MCQQEYRNKELNNGRLAMIAAAGITYVISYFLLMAHSLPSSSLTRLLKQGTNGMLTPLLLVSMKNSVQEKFVTGGLPEFEIHRFALSDVYNSLFL